MKTYSLKEVAKKINIAPGIIRQWEKEFNELLEIPRSKQGARIYSDTEIILLLEIKEMYLQKLSKERIRKSLQKKLILEKEAEPQIAKISKKPEADKISNPSLEIVATETVTPVSVHKETRTNTNQIFEAVDTFKNNFINEVKEEIRTVVRKEIMEEVKREISKGTLTTVKTLSDSIYKSTAHTKAEIEGLSETVEQAAELTVDRLQYLSNSIKDVSLETSDEISTLSKQLADTTNDLAHSIDYTNTELTNLTEAISLDREFFVEERQQYIHEIRQREAAFQQMLINFREVAASKEKKWWKFWSQITRA